MSKRLGAAWGRRKRIQYAALPLAPGPNFPAVLLVTTRRSGRWIIPKGWAEPDLPPHLLATREAFEEAGILGEAEAIPIGNYTYRKCMSDGRRADCRVTVYPMTVTSFADTWPERGQWRRRWASLEEAAALVGELGLARLLRQFIKAPVEPIG